MPQRPLRPVRLFPALLGACLLAAMPALAAPPVRPSAPSAFQIVQSVPEGTTLGDPALPRTQAVWLQMIAGARQQIDIAAFYLSESPGTGLTPVLDALAARARAGVAVRLLVDHRFLATNAASVERLRQVPGISVRVLPADTLTGGVLHAKYMVVDATSVFIGSQNWDWRALDQIHEIGARVDDARLGRSVQAAFAFTWDIAGRGSLPDAAERAVAPPGFAPATASDPVVLDAGSSDPLTVFPAFSPPALVPAWATSEQEALVRMIQASAHVLRVQVMTLSAIKQYGPTGWWSPVDAALRDAAARGVQVRLLVADWALEEPMQAYLKSLAVLPGITVKFSTVPQPPSGFIPYARVEHAKYAVADARSSWIGTGNWEWSYFNTSVDASLFVQGAGPARTLAGVFDRDWDGPYVTTLEPGTRYPAPRTH